MSDALAVHAALAAMRVPTDLALSPTGETLACVLPPVSDPGGPGLVHLLPTGGPGPVCPQPLSLPAGVRGGHALVRWLADGTLLWAVTGPDGELTELVAVDPSAALLADRDGEPVPANELWRVELPGALEDVVVGANRLLLRLADPGCDRDGNHLGTRIGPTEDPMVVVPEQAQRRLALLDLGTRDLTAVPTPGLTVWDAHWAGGDLAVAVVSADPRPAGYYRPSLIALDLAGGGVRQLYETRWQLACPRVSPDQRTAVVVEGLSIVSGQVVQVDLASGQVQRWDDLDDVTDLGWLDEQELWFAGWDGTGVQVGTARTGTGAISRWSADGSLAGPVGQPGMVVGPDRRAYGVWETSEHAPEIALTKIGSPGIAAMTAVNTALTPLAAGVQQQQVSWTATDGQNVAGLLLVDTTAAPPPAGRPLVVLCHGGPTWLWASSFAPAESNRLALPLARAGAAVLLPNPRGSSGRGQEYARAVIGAMGAIDLDDVFAGVDALAEQGAVDPDRVAVMGLSYGGYLSAMAAVTCPQRVRAAVVISGVSDWLSFHTASNIGGGYDDVYHCDADPRTSVGRERLVARSPLYLIDGQGAPTLVLHGREDRVTPVGQAEQLYQALASAGVATELVVYPREGHEFVEAHHCSDVARRVVGWLTLWGVL